MEGDRSNPDALRDRFYAQVAEATRDAIGRIMRAGASDLYVVGGVVRDLLLDRAVTDIDLVCEDDAIERVRAAFPGEHITTHARFGTASIVIDGARVDVSTARSETYSRPGVLPVVEPANIEVDLRRRDFSINAIALRLTGVAQLTDPYDGVADLSDKLIRVLHDASFRDDPTRILRAYRYAARLQFAFETRTRSLLRSDSRFLADVSGARLRRELELLLAEKTGGVALEAAEDGGTLNAIHTDLSWDAGRSSSLAARAPDIPLLPFGFALLSAGALQHADAIAARLRLRLDEAAAVTGIGSMQETAKTLRRSEAKPSGVTVLLDRYTAAAVAAFAATTDDGIAGQVVLRYLAEWRFVRPLLRGNDLIALGIPEGPQIQRGLQLIRAARLDGWAEDEGDERALALRFAKSVRDSSIMRADVELQVNGH